MAIPFDLLIGTYEVICNCPEGLEEIVAKETLKRTEKILETLGEDKLGRFLYYWGILLKRTDHAEPFVQVFERSFIKLVNSSALENLQRFVGTAKTSILFASRESRERLLNAIATSEYNSELFIILTKLQEFTETIHSLDPSIYKEWYDHSFSIKVDTKKHDIKQVCHRLNEILSPEGNIEKREVVKIVQNILILELKKSAVESILRVTDVFEKCLIKDVLVETFMEHVSEEVRHTSSDVLKLLEPFTVQGILRIETRFKADIIYLIVDKYANMVELSSEKQVLSNVFKMNRFYTVLFKCQGEFTERIKVHPFCIRIVQFVHSLVEKLTASEIDYKLMKYISSKQYEVEAFAVLICGSQDILALIDSNMKIFNDEIKRIETVKYVLSTIKSKAVNVPRNFEKVIDDVKEREASLYSGHITGNTCHLLWESMEKIPGTCLQLLTVVKSVVFWNLLRDKLANMLEERIDTDVSGQPIENHDLHSNTNQEGNTADMEGEKGAYFLQSSLDYIEMVQTDGLQLYKDYMQTFLTDNNQSMKDILDMFNSKPIMNSTSSSSKPDIDKEKDIADKTLCISYDHSTWNTLTRIYSIGDIASKVNIIRLFLTVFEKNLTGDQTVSDALESFDKLLRGNVNEYTFLQVKTSLEMVYSIVNKLSESTFDIMSSIGHCSSLIDFLRDILDEDIRNLIDAVEDISEQQVQESTVSGLIEIKQLLFPILKQNLSCQHILNVLEDQVKEISNSSTLPAKVQQCVENIHNLRSLYNNVANRGEQTKQIVKHILDCGFFTFQLNDKTQTVQLQAVYTLNEKTVTKERAELSDLRSRSLLLMNTDRKESLSSQLSREQVETFVTYVDESIELAELYSQLHTSGHCSYILIDKQVESSALSAEIKKLAKESHNWEIELFEERKKHYLMNFIHGFGLHSMYEYLSTGEKMKSGNIKTLECAVQTILNFIHPEMIANKFKDTFFEENGSCQPWSSAAWLHCLGMALHTSYLSISETCDKKAIYTKGTADSLKMTDVVQKGKLFLAQLDENSLYTVRTVITLYANTVNKMPASHQVLFCTKETSLDEVELLVRRCSMAYKFYKETPLYCIANVELLPSELYADFLDILGHISENYVNFLLALVCRGTNSHQIIEELNEYKTTVAPVSDALVKNIFKTQHENVLTLTSDLAGMGKTSQVFKKAHIEKKVVSTFHISGTTRKFRLVERLDSLKVNSYHILHIDIGTVDDPKELDTFLFELLILRYVSAGRISVALRTEYVVLEIANTINESLRNSLQTALLFSREHLIWKKFDDFLVSKEIQSPVQIVCKYLSFNDIGCLDRKNINLDVCKPLSTNRCRKLLKSFFGLEDELSFPVVRATLDVLADQFKKMTCSPFFKVSRLQDMIGNKGDQTFKSSLVMAMATSTKEFASRSVSSCRSTQASTTQYDEDTTPNSNDLSTHIMQRTKGMIRWEDSNHLMFVFHCQNIQTLSPIYRDQSKVPCNIRDIFCRQMNKELQDFRALSQSELQNLLQKIARNNPTPLPSSELAKIASGYALTPDNLLKMVLIMLRIKAGVPVVIMGETGCGKTSLVRYLASICEVHFDVLNIHAGVTEETIIETVDYHCSESMKCLQTERWLFLDEINTSESIGVMTEIICHQKCLGKPIPPNLVVMGACNPYKLRSKKDIATAGLTIKSQNDELSRLVYRVLPLPEMMVDYVWDFGCLNDNDEKLYIMRMVDGLLPNEKFHNLFSDLLSASQSFVRQKEASSYAVSLRDVNRCSILIKWFENILRNKKPLKEYSLNCDLHIRAMILSLAHCYHCRFSSKDTRSDYRKTLRAKLKEYNIPEFDISHDVIADIIVEEQKDFIFRMELPEGTACNSALMENVFVIIVCIYNRLPIFVVGKPGCSKSLAMQLIRSNLRGKDSKDPFFKTLQQLYCVSFQGSESSTSDGILKVFKKALNYQSSNSADCVLSVVILDEIGLAEVSRFNPLKVLHNLLEPDGELRPHVAVVGLSNWSLDASKMNRAIHLSRTDMDEEELYNTAKAISESYSTKRTERDSSSTISFLDAVEYTTEIKNADIIKDIEHELQGIAKSFKEYSNRSRFKNFHGLRDFYALVKYVARQLTTVSTYQESLQTDLVSNVVQSGLERNFGGLPTESKTLYEIFNVYFNLNINIKRNVLDLIKENVNDHIARHLLLVTCGDSSLGILEQQLNSIGRSTREVIFGSQFEDDLTDDYNYRILSRIILCMEEGIILILKDLENIYGSLYDMLNQNYAVIGNKRNCRVALGAYSNPICQVAKSFRCIVLMDETKVKRCDPPFLNRFEKQYIRFLDVLTTEQKNLVDQLKEWIKGLKDIQERSYDFTDMFPVYSDDLVPSLVLKTEREKEKIGLVDESISVIDRCKTKLLWIFKPEAIVRLKRAIAPTAMHEADEIKAAYFDLPIHCGLDSFISSQLKNLSGSTSKEGILTIVFTNSSMHISLQQSLLCKNVQTEKLGTFKSEKQVSNKIQHFWSLDSQSDILIIQCSAVDDEKHILLTKSIIERHRSTYVSKSNPSKHVYLIVHTPMYKGSSEAVSQLNFMSDWNLVMLDSLESSDTDLPSLCDMDILKAIENKRPLDKSLIALLFWSFTRIKYSPHGRDVDSINAILTKMKQSQEFLTFLDESIWKIVSDMEIQEKDWQIKVACDIQALRNSSSFVDALEQYIMRVIRIPLTKLIFCLESHGLLESYFVEDTVSADRRNTWLDLVQDERLFSIAKIPDETGPECYSCDTPDCALQMPFSKMIFSIIEQQRDEFIEDLSILKSNYKIDDQENVPLTLIEDVLATQEKLALRNIPDLNRFCYETFEKDYIHDFSSLISVTFCSGMRKIKRAKYMEWIVRQKSDIIDKTKIDIIVRLHATTWMNTSLFRAEMQLLALCEKVGLEKETLEHVIQTSGLECR
ncbi:E3 ubiquitin-protein ligase rnf213-beta-like, partial [Ruditapes philippinarum]|uniref:E3 ubiquitin-protein ligase rnf213-beta-like n=1 Tax=Ruditapes philippinarum TaxID=129788 RepID=UPI00295B29D5